MATTSTYFDAAYPAPWQVLGVPLKPFSLGHYVKLYRLGCAFVADEVKPATLGDLLLGVAVCSMDSHPDPSRDPFWLWLNRAEPEGYWSRLWYRARKKVCKGFVTPAELDMFKFGKRIGTIDFGEKARLFAEYIALHSKVPAYWEGDSSGDGKKSGAHWSQAVLHTLTSKCGYTQEEAHNVPLSRALADFFKYAESEGGLRLMTQEERKALGL